MSQLSPSLSAASRSILCGIALFAVSIPAALALPIVMQSFQGTELAFGNSPTGSGLVESFWFNQPGGPGQPDGPGQLIDPRGAGTLNQVLVQPASASSVFNISNISLGPSGTESAMINGTVPFFINSRDGAGILRADLSFSSITLQGGRGFIGGNLLITNNFSSPTGFFYDDYNILAADGQGAFNISFDYNQSSSLSNLITNGDSISSFTAEITPASASVPVAVPIWMFASALAGIAGIRYRHTRKVQGKA